jgi:hypothetical protein
MAQPNGLNPQFHGVVGTGMSVGTVAGGAKVLDFGSTSLGLYFGSGAPTISAIKGSLYVRTDGSSSSTRIYVNNGTTTWVAVTTAS